MVIVILQIAIKKDVLEKARFVWMESVYANPAWMSSVRMVTDVPTAFATRLPVMTWSALHMARSAKMGFVSLPIASTYNAKDANAAQGENASTQYVV